MACSWCTSTLSLEGCQRPNNRVVCACNGGKKLDGISIRKNIFIHSVQQLARSFRMSPYRGIQPTTFFRLRPASGGCCGSPSAHVDYYFRLHIRCRDANGNQQPAFGIAGGSRNVTPLIISSLYPTKGIHVAIGPHMPCMEWHRDTCWLVSFDCNCNRLRTFVPAWPFALIYISFPSSPVTCLLWVLSQ
jgi:hypothetical protein